MEVFGVHDEHSDGFCPCSQEAVEAVGVRGCNDVAGLPAVLGDVFGPFKGRKRCGPFGAGQICRI